MKLLSILHEIKTYSKRSVIPLSKLKYDKDTSYMEISGKIIIINDLHDFDLWKSNSIEYYGPNQLLQRSINPNKKYWYHSKYIMKFV